MTPLTEIGEFLIGAGRREYFFRPSFAAMTRIGSPAEVVQAFYDLNHDAVSPLLARAYEAYGSVPAWLMEYVSKPGFADKTIGAAINILQACCEDDCAALTGAMVPSRSRPGELIWMPGAMSFAEMVMIASSLITHGIIGKAKVRKLQRNESGQMTREFHAIEYINAARSHFGISKDEAMKLTMTEFQLLLNTKYPEQKGFTKEEYDTVVDDYFAKKQRKLDKAA
jgi:hypothetical protein